MFSSHQLSIAHHKPTIGYLDTSFLRFTTTPKRREVLCEGNSVWQGRKGKRTKAEHHQEEEDAASLRVSLELDDALADSRRVSKEVQVATSKVLRFVEEMNVAQIHLKHKRGADLCEFLWANCMTRLGHLTPCREPLSFPYTKHGCSVELFYEAAYGIQVVKALHSQVCEPTILATIFAFVGDTELVPNKHCSTLDCTSKVVCYPTHCDTCYTRTHLNQLDGASEKRTSAMNRVFNLLHHACGTTTAAYSPTSPR